MGETYIRSSRVFSDGNTNKRHIEMDEDLMEGEKMLREARLKAERKTRAKAHVFRGLTPYWEMMFTKHCKI